MRRRGTLITFFVLVVALAVGFVGRDLMARRQAAQLAEQTAQELAQSSGTTDDVIMLADHDVTIYTNMGEPVSFADIANGQPLVINFWATWCPYCVDELPDFQKIVADYGDRVAFAFVDVADGQRERADDARQWLVDNGFEVGDFVLVCYDPAQKIEDGDHFLVTPTRVEASSTVVEKSMAG